MYQKFIKPNRKSPEMGDVLSGIILYSSRMSSMYTQENDKEDNLK